jgi:hypothetical protein
MEPEPGFTIGLRGQVGIQGRRAATTGGGLSEVSLSVGLVGLELNHDGGRLFARSPSFARRATCDFRRDGAHMMISTVELEAWIHFFLKYHRDGVGEVDHIDVDFSPKDSVQELVLVLHIPDVLPPIQEREARRRLGLS